jgi:hypothetical protein
VVVLSVYTGTFMIGGDTDVVLNPDRYGIRVTPNERGGFRWAHKDETFKTWDLPYYNAAHTVRSDIVLLNHGHFVLYHAERPGTVLNTTGFGRIGRLAREIPSLEEARPFVPPGNRIRGYRFDPAPGEGDLHPGKEPYRLAYVARSGGIFPADPLTQAIFDRADGETALETIAEKTGYPREKILETASLLIDQGLIAGWIDLP